MENINDNVVVLEIEELLGKICGSTCLIKAIIDSKDFKTKTAQEFEVFILSNGKTEHNTLRLPKNGIIGKICWRVEMANEDMVGISEWAAMAGWKISCVQAKFFQESTGRFKDINEKVKKITLPYTTLDSIFYKSEIKKEELNAAVFWIKSHNTMIGNIVRGASKESC